MARFMQIEHARESWQIDHYRMINRSHILYRFKLIAFLSVQRS